MSLTYRTFGHRNLCRDPESGAVQAGRGLRDCTAAAVRPAILGSRVPRSRGDARGCCRSHVPARRCGARTSNQAPPVRGRAHTRRNPSSDRGRCRTSRGRRRPVGRIAGPKRPRTVDRRQTGIAGHPGPALSRRCDRADCPLFGSLRFLRRRRASQTPGARHCPPRPRPGRGAPGRPGRRVGSGTDFSLLSSIRAHQSRSGCSAAWLAHLTGGQGVAGSNPAIPTNFQKRGNTGRSYCGKALAAYSPTKTMLTFLVDACRMRLAS